MGIRRNFNSKKMNIDEITLKRFMEIYVEEHNVVNFDMSLLDDMKDEDINDYQKVKVR